MHTWFKRRRNRRKSTVTRQAEKGRAIRQLLSESLEQRMLLTTVTSVDPAENSLAAPVSTNISATFDQAVTAGTSDTTFVVQGSQSVGRLQGGDTAVSASGNTVTHDPANNFKAGELVRATVTNGITTTGAANPYVWEFRTAVGGGLGTFTNTGQVIADPALVGPQTRANTQGVALGDVDGDGDLDAVTANADSTNARVYLNDGAAVFTDSGQGLGAVGGGQDAELGDIDGDGDLDAIISRNGANDVFINDGAGVFTAGAGIGGENTREFKLADFDGDGDLDGVAANAGGNTVWRNDGTGVFTQSGSLGNHNTISIGVGDVDNDGDIDIIEGTTIGQANRVWINNGSGTFTDSGQSLGDTATKSSREIVIGDVDGDGDADFWVANQDYVNKLFLNDGSGVFSDSGQILDSNPATGGNPLRTRGGRMGDFDSDGDLDILETNQSRQVNRLWTNNGSGVFTASNLPGPNSYRPDLDVGDLDGDGDLDLFFTGTQDLSFNASSQSVWTNDNPVINVSLAVDNASVSEAAGVATVTATISGTSGSPVTVSLGLSGTATDGVDYNASGTEIVIPGGSTSGSITITGVDDALDEADETVVVDITGVAGATGTGQVTVTLTDDDDAPTVTLALDNASIAENGGVATATATLSAASGQDVTIDLAVGGTATDGDDYTLSASQIVIPAGETSGAVTITSTDDDIDEPDETVVLDISAATGATEDGEQQVTATITDDDEPPTVALSIDNESIDEDGGVATVTVAMSAQSLSDVTVNLAVSGTATAGTDYNLSGNQVVIPAGQTSGSVTITSIADLLITEGGETVIVDIDSVTNATEDGTQQVTATIIDDVGGPEVTLAIDNGTIAEAGGTATVTATLASAFSLDVTVELGLSGTASATDYNLSASQIVVPAGQTTAAITITAVDDALIEADETVIVDAAAVINGEEATEQQVTTTITDDETKPSVTLAIDNASIAEGATATVTATSSAVSEQDVTVTLAFSGTATQPDGFTVDVTEIVIAAGSTSGTAVITATDEGVDDGDQTVVVDIDAVANGTEDGTQQVTTTILDDDEAPPIPPGPEPARNAHDVPRNNQVAFNFGDNVTAATEQTFVVHGTLTSGQLVGDKTDFSVDGPIVSHMPTGQFAAGEIINVTATAGITTSAGAITPTVWQFRTAVNAGSGIFEDSGQVIPGGPGFVVLGDADGDGDLDALQGANLLLNDGSGVFTDSGQNVGTGQERDFADVDGDGDLDVVSNRIDFNDGAGNFTAGGAVGGGLAIDVGDVDGDGDLDLFRRDRCVTAAITSLAERRKRQLYEHRPEFGSTAASINRCGVELGDFDNDGDLDAFEGNWQTVRSNLVLFQWYGAGNFTFGFRTILPDSFTSRQKMWPSATSTGTATSTFCWVTVAVRSTPATADLTDL